MGSSSSQTTTNAAMVRTTSASSFTPLRPITRATSAVVAAVTKPSSTRTGTNSRSGSSRYAPSAPGRSLRSAASRSDSRIRALNAASIAPRYTPAPASRKISNGVMLSAQGTAPRLVVLTCAQSSFRGGRLCAAAGARASACVRCRFRDRSPGGAADHAARARAIRSTPNDPPRAPAGARRRAR